MADGSKEENVLGRSVSITSFKAVLGLFFLAWDAAKTEQPFRTSSFINMADKINRHR